MFGYKIVKTEVIENLEKSISALKDRVNEVTEAFDAEVENFNNLHKKYTEALALIDELKNKQEEKEDVKKEEVKKVTPRKKRVYRKKSEKKSEEKPQ